MTTSPGPITLVCRRYDHGASSTRYESLPILFCHTCNFSLMATVTRTSLVDDLDESEGDVENVLLALDGTNYEIDLIYQQPMPEGCAKSWPASSTQPPQ